MKDKRDYNSDKIPEVKRHYENMRKYQSIKYYYRMFEKWTKFDKAELNLYEIFDMLDDYVDCSDPDINIPNRYHAFQTAEAMRKNEEPEWFQLVGLIHDIGKIMVNIGGLDSDGQSNRNQWGVSGDTFILGTELPNSLVLSEYNHNYKDVNVPYPDSIGITNVKWSWGHDEYLYLVLKNHYTNNNETIENLPPIALDIIRLHSAYVWHSEEEYTNLMKPEDITRLEWVRKFNKYDLYTKKQEYPIVDLKYYEILFNKFIGKTLKF